VRVRGLAAAALVALVLVGTASAEPAHVGYPSSMASTGDSITRGFNDCGFPYIDCPASSWSTGTNSTVNSHYRRILAVNPAIAGRNANDATTGADMADLLGQVQAAVSQSAQYVTILMGANDVCASSEAGMTPVATFRAQFQQALATLSAGLPNARIYVVSIPDIYNLWAIYRGSFTARTVWSLAGICQSMLANPGSTSATDEGRRQRVRQRNIDYNAQLAQACVLFVHCRFDGNVGFNTAFLRSDVTTRDYFHPSVAGQAKLAAVSWSAGFDFSDATAPSSAGALANGVATITATDDRGVSGVEYRLNGGGWARYVGPVPVAPGSTITWRAVDVNGNSEATHSLTG
jgi:lysophospholipase L1-like esterase